MKTKNKIRTALFLHADQMQSLESHRMLAGTPVAESIRRAIDEYLEKSGISNTAAHARIKERSK